MTKCINFELSKRLNDLGLLEDIETEYAYKLSMTKSPKLQKYKPDLFIIKTLTLEEAINLIKYKKYGIFIFGIGINFNNGGECFIGLVDKITDYSNLIDSKVIILNIFKGKNQIDAIEKMIEFLLDNNLLGKQ